MVVSSMKKHERVRLLFGPYRAPALRVRDRIFCLFRDCEVVVTSWTDGRIPWPRCQPLHTRGGSGILVDEELARAVRSESSAAIQFWWGAAEKTVWRWRRALGVALMDSEGTRRLRQESSEKGAARVRGQKLAPEQVEQRRRSAIELNLGQYLRTGFHGPRWTKKQVAMLGTAPDDVVARRVGRTTEAVRVMRSRLGIPNPRDRQRS